MTPKARRQAGAASMMGTAVEAFDIVIYAFLVVYTAQVWFPSDDPAVSVIATLGVYGAGFLARPLGGIYFGRLGDRVGRRRVLIMTLGLTGLATFSLGLIPSYAAIGVFAPLLVVIARLVQGFAAGGEVMGAATYALESSSPGRRGLYSSFTPWGSFFGLSAATVVIGATAAIVGPEAMAAWGWRIPFYVALVITFGLLLFRLRIADSAEFQVLKKNDGLSKSPLRDAWRDHKLTILLTIFMGTGILYVTYSINVYVPVYLTTVTGLSPSTVPWMVAVVMILGGSLTPIGGLLADRFGRVRMLTIMLVISAIAGMPIFIGLSNASLGLVGIGFVYFCAVGLGALVIAPAYQAFSDVFPAKIRFTAAAIGFNVSNMIGAGFGPLLSAEVIRSTGDPGAPGWLLSIGAVLGIIGLLSIVRLHGRATRAETPLTAEPTETGTAAADRS